MLKNFFRLFAASIQFISTIPLGKRQSFEPLKIAGYFPLVGLILGLFVCAFDQLALLLWSQPIVSLLDVVLLIILTGAFHLDGLADSADGLFSHRSKDKVLAIMKDSRIGVMGVIAVVCILAIKCGAIMELEDNRCLLLILVPAYSRGSMLFGIQYLQYGRADEGTGYGFFTQRMDISSFWGFLLLVPISFLLGWQFLWLNITFILCTILILIYYYKRLGCITGDTLGAMNEFQEAVLFLVMAIN